jgi:hypothetical protein
MPAVALGRALAAALTLALVAVGCGGDKSPTAPRDTVAGTYTLREIDGLAIPAQIHNGPWYDPTTNRFYNRFVLRGTQGTVTLTPDKHYTARLEFDGTADGKPFSGSLSGAGTYALQGSAITFTATGGDDIGDFDGTLQQGTITFELEVLAQVRPSRFVLRK